MKGANLMVRGGGIDLYKGIQNCPYIDQGNLDYYFSLLKKTLEGNNILDQACYIYSMDETGILLDHKQSKCIASKDMKKVYGPSSGNKTQITILATLLILNYHLWLFLKVNV